MTTKNWRGIKWILGAVLCFVFLWVLAPVTALAEGGNTTENYILNGTIYGTVTLASDYTVAEGRR